MVLEQSEDFEPDPRQYMKLQGRILKAVQTWYRRQGLPYRAIWWREEGGYGEHTHVLLPLPPEHRSALAELICRVGKLHDRVNNRAVVITPEKDPFTGEEDTRGARTAAQLAGLMRDGLKTLSPKAFRDGVQVLGALGVRHRAPCVIHGKRSGTSESISRAARAKAGWREVTELAALRAMLLTKEEAKQRRQQRRKKRSRPSAASRAWAFDGLNGDLSSFD